MLCLFRNIYIKWNNLKPWTSSKVIEPIHAALKYHNIDPNTILIMKDVDNKIDSYGKAHPSFKDNYNA